MKKFALKLKDLSLLGEIDTYIRRFDMRGADLPQAASDVLDGLVMRDEVKHLIAGGLFHVVKTEPTIGRPRDIALSGDGWTLYLTDRACQVFWPDRIAA